jgi:hypothetical protein
MPSKEDIVRQEYRQITPDEQKQIKKIKKDVAELIEYFQSLGSTRELSLAITKLEEAVFWSVKHVTK